MSVCHDLDPMAKSQVVLAASLMDLSKGKDSELVRSQRH